MIWMGIQFYGLRTALRISLKALAKELSSGHQLVTHQDALQFETGRLPIPSYLWPKLDAIVREAVPVMQWFTPDKLAFVRERLSLTREAASQKLGVARPTLRRIEAGTFQPDYYFIKKLQELHCVAVATPEIDLKAAIHLAGGQNQLAKLLGKNKATVSRWINGSRKRKHNPITGVV